MYFGISGAFLGLEPPLTGNHGQGASAPQLPCFIIIIGIILFQQMPEAPGHDVVPTDHIPLTSLRDAEFSGNGFAERRFFSDEETLDHGVLSIQKVAIGSEAAFEGGQQGRDQAFFQFFGLKVGVEALPSVVFNAQGVPIERRAPSFGVVIAGDFL